MSRASIRQVAAARRGGDGGARRCHRGLRAVVRPRDERRGGVSVSRARGRRGHAGLDQDSRRAAGHDHGARARPRRRRRADADASCVGQTSRVSCRDAARPADAGMFAVTHRERHARRSATASPPRARAQPTTRSRSSARRASSASTCATSSRSGLGLEPRTDEDSGDIYGPAGTKVHLTITTDKPIARGVPHARRRHEGRARRRSEQVLDGELTIEDDGSYRVALADLDGLENAGDTEYFIRTLDDRPPDVRILRPAGDKQVTALEEVQIEARADDDYGIAAFDLVFQAPGGKEKVVPVPRQRRADSRPAACTRCSWKTSACSRATSSPTSRARATSSRGRRSTEARSDIFFLEVKPFEEEFVAAQSQSMGQGGGGDRGLQGLAEAQKEIIVATWKLDARARRARDAKSSRRHQGRRQGAVAI